MSNQIRLTLTIQVNDLIFHPVSLIILIIGLLFPLSSLSQVIIKEKFSIDSLSTKQGHVSKDGGSRGNGTVFSSSSVFVQCSGHLTFRSAWPVTGGFGDCATITMNGNTIFQGSLNQARDEHTVIDVGRVGAGATLAFTFSDIGCSGLQDISLLANADAIGIDQTFNGLYFILSEEAWPTLNLYLSPDSSTCLDLRPQTGPPRQLQPFHAPADTHLVYWACCGNNYGPSRDTLYFNTKSDSLRLDPAIEDFCFAMVDLGDVKASDTLEFSLFSGQRGVKGEKFYAKGFTFTPDNPPDPSAYDLYLIDYENWIDNNFGNYLGFLFLTQERYNITFDKSSAAPGDTVRMFVDVFGSPEDPNTDMDVNILDGRQYAHLEDTLGTVFGPDIAGASCNYRPYSRITHELRIVIDSTAPPNGRIVIQVVNQNDELTSGRAILNFHSSILLGETKYYQAVKDPTKNSKLIFKELKQTNEATAQEFSNVSFAVTQETGDKLGVYWEHKDEEGDNLRADVLRVVGRYWKEGDQNKYKVKLSATADGRTGDEVVEVKRPAKLGNSDSTVTDVLGHANINLDSLIIEFAGEYGIPPQIIKGQMQKEVSSFSPAWRYEPFKDVTLQSNKKSQNKYFRDNMPFVVNDTTMGSGDYPTLHTNENPYPYIGTPTKIAAFLAGHWNTYVKNGTGNVPDSIVASNQLTDRWQQLYTRIKNDTSKVLDDADARKKAHAELKQEIQNNKNTIGRSFDFIAQTRKVTSYGLTQMTYITAADNVFDNNHDTCRDPSTTYYVDQSDIHDYPEKLNEQNSLMPRYCDFLWKKLILTFTGCIPEGNWSGGFEIKWKAALKKYNPGEAAYGRDVMTNAQNFKPTN